MRLNHILVSAFVAGIATSITVSCSDSFLEENLITDKSTLYFTTRKGLDDLSTGAYQKLKFKFNYVWAINCYNMGVDEFTGGANDMAAWNHYGTSLNSGETSSLQPVWDNYYGLIEPANIIIQNVPQYYGTADTYNTRAF